jgi:Zn ribbon nucleic-acid-binding protein
MNWWMDNIIMCITCGYQDKLRVKEANNENFQLLEQALKNFISSSRE